MSTRRDFLCAAGAWLALPASPCAIRRIERRALWRGRDGATTWFHPRACLIPNRRPALFMTLQSISGSDYFGPVHWSESHDLGKIWSHPQPIPGMGRVTHPDGVEEGSCDTVPEYHSPTGTVLALAHNVYYKGGKLTRPNERRWPVYIVRDRQGRWSALRKLEWDNPEASAMYTSGCSQRVTLPGGDILVPLSYAPVGRSDRAVCTVLCSFDGRMLTVRKTGNEHRLAVKRGLLEPSLANVAGRYYMTIRAEDGRGYSTVSGDGLRWEPIRPWCWDDGEPLALSSTQQRWLPHSEGLWLVDTRKDASNLNVMRWRSPLFVAQVDTRNLCLLRATERLVFPLSADGVKAPNRVAHLGNFHTNVVTREFSLVTVGEVLPEEGYRGDTLAARIYWTRPNGNL
ncbi:MAG: glycoside hydrolase [Acidobacteria bacterium]|nr:glycoside hydrolase [Acidobacteriota bacterium]